MEFIVISLMIVILLSSTFSDDSHNTDPCEDVDTGIYPHSECQMYYNCSMKNTDMNYRHWLGDHLIECPYPMLFDSKTKSCEKFNTVDCGNRIEFKHGCEYHNNQCFSAHCRPCVYDYSSCSVENGVIAMDSMPNTPYYGVCEGWRFTKKQCPDGKIFDGRSKLCI